MEAGGVSFLIALFTTPLLIRYLRKHKFGQRIREDGPQTHLVKEGTPTMGGIVIVAAAMIGYLVGHIGTSVSFSRAGILAASVTA
jgi:phospho-N-acetylmuramoyl-pentapeptide-transferase